MNKSTNYKNGWNVSLRFGIKLHKKDKALLELIRAHFSNIGSITNYRTDALQFRVSSTKDLKVIFKHFDSFPLITQKWSDYQLFKQAYVLIVSKEHLTEDGIEKLIAIKSIINKGLSDDLKAHFPNVIPIPRPLIHNQEINDYWLAGFIDGEGCFYISIAESKTKIGNSVSLRFQITQHIRDKALLESFVNFFGCGRIEIKTNDSYTWVDYVTSKFSDITEKIIPFLNKYLILGIKSKNFDDFCKVAELMKSKEHLTSDGLEKIKLIKKGMNSNRIS